MRSRKGVLMSFEGGLLQESHRFSVCARAVIINPGDDLKGVSGCGGMRLWRDEVGQFA